MVVFHPGVKQRHYLISAFQTLGCRPIASVDHLSPENLGSADLFEEVQTGSSKIVKVGDDAAGLGHIYDLVPKGAQEKRTEVLENKVDRM